MSVVGGNLSAGEWRLTMGEPAHVVVMEKMTDTTTDLQADATAKDPKFRIRRGVVFGTALTVIGVLFAALYMSIPVQGANSLFLLTTFSLGGGLWLLFDAYMEYRTRADRSRDNVTSIKERFGRD
ncbi:hypothetical protein ACFVAJ_16445 [Agromyces sp. NPDC057679]|uniref:hypothetical protein n=1 Tax=Agromyces sp. NPDC057679 TaxID=3346207 RepID=UPI00366E983E